MSSTPPPPLPNHSDAPPPPRPQPALAPYQKARVKPAKTPEEKVNAEVRSNLIGAGIFIGLMVLVQWASRRPARAEVIDEVGSILLFLADLAAVVLITLEPFHLRRRKAAAAAGEGV